MPRKLETKHSTRVNSAVFSERKSDLERCLVDDFEVLDVDDVPFDTDDILFLMCSLINAFILEEI